MTILGIDPGSNITGWALIEGQHLLASGEMKLRGKRMASKLADLYPQLCGLLDKHKPDAVALETPFVGRNAKTAIVLGEVRGVVLLACEDCGYAPYDYAPAEVKRAVGCKGNADKLAVQGMVAVLFGLSEPLPLDASDAAAVAWCHTNRMP